MAGSVTKSDLKAPARAHTEEEIRNAKPLMSMIDPCQAPHLVPPHLRKNCAEPDNGNRSNAPKRQQN